MKWSHGRDSAKAQQHGLPPTKATLQMKILPVNIVSWHYEWSHH